ncbi:MAG: metallophosphoesterase [Candidatus Heimdallarchaeota archaeon]|nr:metallophosphoesterase [Candidatus Heimdallarchaeota archaeon]
MSIEKQKISPPEDRIPSTKYRIKIRETIRRRLAEEENFYPLELEDFDEVKYKPYTTTEKEDESIPPVKFIIDKYYMMRITNDASKILVSVYLDYGFLKTNRVKEVVDVNKKKPFLSNPKGRCVIRLFNDDFCELAEIPMKHSSSFSYHPVSSAPQLFLGLIENLAENKNYHYRIECYNKDEELIGASKIREFTAGVQSGKQPVFFVSTSDLHGGSKARFKRGKVVGFKAKVNPRLERLMKHIHVKELDYTFDKGYQVFTTSGDNVDNGSYHEYWADLFTCGNVNFARIPFTPTIGNHDYFNGGWGRASWFGGKARTQKHFHMFIQTPRTKGGAYFSQDVGNVHMIHLDSIGLNWGNESIACESRQWNWLNEELKEWRRKAIEEQGPQFCIVFLHSAIFTIGYFGRARNNSDALAQSCLTPLFDDYGVSAAIFGHDHLYQRSLWRSTQYMCIGVSGKMSINYFDWLRDRTDYKVMKDEEGEKARGYGVTYVAPNVEDMSEDEKIRFEEWLFSVKNKILNSDLSSFYIFETEEEIDNYKELMVNRGLKEKFIEEKIIEKMRTCIWWRYYNLKGKLVDSAFMESIERVLDEDYINCPNPHIR